MDRLTKKISLVLVSGSLAMGGCIEEPPSANDPRTPPVQAEKDEQDPGAGAPGANAPGVNTPGTNTTGTGGGMSHTSGFHHSGHTTVVPMFFGSRGGTSSGGMSASPSSGFRSGSTTHSSVGSSRGGFGSSAHAVGS